MNAECLQMRDAIHFLVISLSLCSRCPSVSLEFHVQMIQIQNNNNKKSARVYMHNACNKFVFVETRLEFNR